MHYSYPLGQWTVSVFLFTIDKEMWKITQETDGQVAKRAFFREYELEVVLEIKVVIKMFQPRQIG